MSKTAKTMLSKKNNIAGKKFGMLTAVKKTRKSDDGAKWYWLCKCDCGNEKEVATGDLKNFLITNCGCKRRKKRYKNEIMNELFDIYNDHGELSLKELLSLYNYSYHTLRNHFQTSDMDKIWKTIKNMNEKFKTEPAPKKEGKKNRKSENKKRKVVKRKRKEKGTSQTGHNNIYLRENGKFSVQVPQKKHLIYIGIFDTIEKAVEARNMAWSVIDKEKDSPKSPSNVLNLTGKKFGRLKVIMRAGTTDKGNSLWFCKCKCDNVGIYYGTGLKNGSITSCGCGKQGQIDNAKHALNTKHTVDGVQVPLITKKVRSDSDTGYKGVTRRKARKGRKERYEAYIRVDGKRIHLGSSTDINEAIQMRKDGEKKYYGEIIKKYDERMNKSE